MAPHRFKMPKEQPPCELEHPLILYTTDGKFRCIPPLGNATASPPSNIYTKRIMAKYCSYSKRCTIAVTKNNIETLEDLHGRAPVGYSQFARYYNQYAPDQGKQFTIYNYTEDHFVVLANPVAHSNFYLMEHPPHKSNKPYNKSTSFTSLLQQSHRLKGIDGLLADLLLTSASAQASKAKQGTLHFGIRKSKRSKTAFGPKPHKSDHSVSSYSSPSTTGLPEDDLNLDLQMAGISDYDAHTMPFDSLLDASMPKASSSSSATSLL